MNEETSINVIRAKLWADAYIHVLNNDIEYMSNGKLPNESIPDLILKKFDERFNDDKR